MEIIKLENCVIYRAGHNKKVKFVNDESKFSEIVVKHETNKIVEVDK